MSTYTTDKASPFTRAVVNSMRKLCVSKKDLFARLKLTLFFYFRYPEALADKSFDNTGCEL